MASRPSQPGFVSAVALALHNSSALSIEARDISQRRRCSIADDRSLFIGSGQTACLASRKFFGRKLEFATSSTTSFSDPACRPFEISCVDAGFPIPNVSTQFISNVATLGLQLCLKQYKSVSVKVESKELFSLLQGKIESVNVSGEDWRTPKGLSCRSLKVRTTEAPISIDLPAVLAGRILLHKVCPASVRIVLNATDLNNFLRSPLIGDAVKRVQASGTAVTNLRVLRIAESVMDMSCEWAGSQWVLRVSCSRDGRPLVSVLSNSALPRPNGVGASSSPSAPKGADGDGSASALGGSVERFLNTLVVDLSGTICHLVRLTVVGDAVSIDAVAKITRFPVQQALQL